jgi:hypothetical protein
MAECKRQLKAAMALFGRLHCCSLHLDGSDSLNGDIDDVDAALALVDEDKIRCHVINCLMAL